ncbi:MAG: beta-lactamase family protein [Acidobacteria bacterium]|nr:beta-lactamase family protein [Acidobacteriota bacterium]
MSGSLRPAALTARLDAHLRRLTSSASVHHALVLVEQGRGGFRWVGASGEAGPGAEPMRAETPFFIASIDKLLTATVVLALSECDRLRLDDRVVTWLSPARLGALHRLDGVDHTGSLTVRHLLTHTSGLADWLEDRPRGGRSLVEQVVEQGDRAVAFDEMLADVRERLTPHFPPQPPGASRPRIRYSDTNFMLLTAIVEAVTGLPSHEVFRARLFEPLDLRQTWVAGHSSPLDPAPEPAALWFGDARLEIPRLMCSFRGIYSTADDLLRFIRALFGGQLFERQATLALMTGRWRRFGVPLDAAALRSPNWPIEYGLGVMRFALPRLLTPFSRVPAVVGHTGSTGCWLFHCAEVDLWLAGTVDQVTAGAVPFRFVPRVVREFTRA